MKEKILIVEDEPTISRIVSSYFQREGYETFTAADGQQGVDLAKLVEPDAICLDIMMPVKDGWQAAKEIREFSKAPIIIMTALSSEEDMIKGYNLMVDDYIVKPFSPKVLIAKVKNMILRLNKTEEPKTIIEAGALKIDLQSYKVFLDAKELPLSKTEFELITFFAQNEGKICSRDLLLDRIWKETKYIDGRIIDTYVKNLRKYLKDYKYIKTVFGIGYRFETNEETN